MILWSIPSCIFEVCCHSECCFNLNLYHRLNPRFCFNWLLCQKSAVSNTVSNTKSNCEAEWWSLFKMFSNSVVATVRYAMVFEHLYIGSVFVSWECWVARSCSILAIQNLGISINTTEALWPSEGDIRWEAQHDHGFTVSLGSCRTWALTHRTLTTKSLTFLTNP